MEIVVILVIAGLVVLALVHRRRRRADPAGTGGADPGPAAPTFGAPVPSFRVVALGPSGSGKTVLLSSMFHELSFFASTRAYMVDTTPQDRLLLNNLYEEVSDTSRPWPRATGRSTEETREFAFRCVGRDADNRTHTIAQITYLDFAGALLEDAGHTASPSFAKVAAAVEEANALLVLLDGRRVRQLLDNADDGRRHFEHTLLSTLNFAQNAECPVHFVVTKWDLLQEFAPLSGLDDADRLAVVADALLHHQHIRGVIEAPGAGRVVRIIPVSSVGAGFVEIDGRGRVVKKAAATPHPTNIEAPLAAVVPDFFRQVEARLDAATRKSVNAELRGRMRLGAGEFASALATMVGRPAGALVRSTLGGLVGVDFGDSAYTLFLDWMGQGYARKGAEIRAFRNDAERQIAVVRAVRTGVLLDFSRTIDRLEYRYPRSLLSSAPRTTA